MPELLYRSVSNPAQVGELELVPQFIPSTLTDVTASDFHVTEVTFTNTTASAVTVTIQDKQSSPVPLFSSVSIEANSTTGTAFRGRLMAGGISWVASTGNAVAASLRGYR